MVLCDAQPVLQRKSLPKMRNGTGLNAQNHAVSYGFYLDKLIRDGVISSTSDDIMAMPAAQRYNAIRLIGEVLDAAKDIDTALQCIRYEMEEMNAGEQWT